MTVSGSSTVVATADLLTTQFGQEIVILNLRDGVYYSVEEIGARIWQLLQTPVTVQTLCDTIVAEFDVTPSVCAEDVRALIGTLVSRGLVDVREDT